MLVLTRRIQESIRIGDSIKVTVLRVKGNTVRIGIEAPQAVHIMRSELADFDSDDIEPAGHSVPDKSIAETGVVETGVVEEEYQLSSSPAPTRLREYMVANTTLSSMLPPR